MFLRSRCAVPLLVIGWLLAACIGCQVPIRTAHVGAEETYRDLDANALNDNKLSPDSRAVLSRFDLAEEYDKKPLSAIKKLHAFAIERPGRPILFALAETSYLAAQQGNWSAGYLASAVYAYHYLFDTEVSPPADPYGRDFRVACDLYNRGLL
jgi:hypothetical protein